MANLAVELEKLLAARGETIGLVAIGKHYNDCEAPDHEPIGSPISWNVARPYLDVAYDAGFGGADCRPFIAWTEKSIYFVKKYDDATHITSVPRHPEPTSVDFY